MIELRLQAVGYALRTLPISCFVARVLGRDTES